MMKKYLLAIIVLLHTTSCVKKPKLDKEALVATICEASKNDTSDDADSIRVKKIFKQHLGPYIKDMPQDSAIALTNFVYIRLQRVCPTFSEIAEDLNPERKKNSWQTVGIEPESEINNDGFAAFFKMKSLKYLEANGDTTLIALTDTIWEDHFKDNSFSRLSLSKTPPNGFVLTFIESNNTIRKDFSRPGDKYRYKILKKENGYYSIFVEVVGTRLKSLFKIYY